MPEPSEPRDSDRVATPSFDELYDCARKLGTCEVVIERIAHRRRRRGLAVVLRRTDDGSAVHRAVVRTSVEEAAARIRRSIVQLARQREDPSEGFGSQQDDRTVEIRDPQVVELGRLACAVVDGER